MAIHSPMLDRSPRSLRAFSLVEIMIAVVIIGLLTALVLPTYRRITMRSLMIYALFQPPSSRTICKMANGRRTKPRA